MPEKINPAQILQRLTALKDQGKILPESFENARPYIETEGFPSWVYASLEELSRPEMADEFNNRFYKRNRFGTSGIRGRTIAITSTEAEKARVDSWGVPEHAALGSAMMNDFNVLRATMGLFRYCKDYLAQTSHTFTPPKLVIAHDVRHFSRRFAELTASCWVRLGGVALLFEGPRSVPQLSFTTRYAGATAGVAITASHNPSHDNGYKVYFGDGALISGEPERKIIEEVEKISLNETFALLERDLSRVIILPPSVDEAYLTALGETLLEPEILKKYPPKMVYSPVHGTGGVMVPRAFEKYGTGVLLVEEQNNFDGRFPTVKYPNPQHAETLELAMKKAEVAGAEAVLATDPDCDRMGAAVRLPDGGWKILNGNLIGSLIAEDRLCKMKELGQLPAEGHPNAVFIKTFVTTPMQDQIAQRHGLACINTLTGFKWICGRVRMYEERLKAVLAKDGVGLDYDRTSFEKRRELLLKYSKYFVFGGEESYGYLGYDCVRDKDANAAVLMFAEMLARLASRGKMITDGIEELYRKYGVHQDKMVEVSFEGADGAAKLKKLVDSYIKSPPKSVGECAIRSVRDFLHEKILDADGETVPPEAMIICDIDGGRFCIRPSGTQPSVRFYCFVWEPLGVDEMALAVQKRAQARLEKLVEALKTNAHERVLKS